MSKKKRIKKNIIKFKAKKGAADLNAPIKIKAAGTELSISPAELLDGAADIKEEIINAFRAYKEGEINTDDLAEILKQSAAETHKYVAETMLKFAEVK